MYLINMYLVIITNEALDAKKNQRHQLGYYQNERVWDTLKTKELRIAAGLPSSHPVIMDVSSTTSLSITSFLRYMFITHPSVK